MKIGVGVGNGALVESPLRKRIFRDWHPFSLSESRDRALKIDPGATGATQEDMTAYSTLSTFEIIPWTTAARAIIFSPQHRVPRGKSTWPGPKMDKVLCNIARESTDRKERTVEGLFEERGRLAGPSADRGHALIQGPLGTRANSGRGQRRWFLGCRCVWGCVSSIPCLLRVVNTLSVKGYPLRLPMLTCVE